MERRSDKIAIYPPPSSPPMRGADKSIDHSKFAIRDFRPRARRTRTSAGGDAGEREGGEDRPEESAESEAEQKWIRDFV